MPSDGAAIALTRVAAATAIKRGECISDTVAYLAAQPVQRAALLTALAALTAQGLIAWDNGHVLTAAGARAVTTLPSPP